MAKKTVVRKTPKMVEEKHVGMETTDWSGVKNVKVAALDTLRHYGYFNNLQDSTKWALSWMKRHRTGDGPKRPKSFKVASHNSFSMTAGSLCKMNKNGYTLRDNDLELIKREIEYQIRRGDMILKSRKSGTKEVTRRSPAEILKEKTSDFLGEIEGILDEYNHKNHKEHMKWSVYDELTIIDAAYNTAKAVHDYYEPLYEELK